MVFGLLYKDLLLAKKNMRTSFWFLFVLFCLGVITLLGITIGNFGTEDLYELFPDIVETTLKVLIGVMGWNGIFFAFNSINVMLQDEESGWYKMLYASPVPLWKEVLSRYLLVIVINTVFVLVQMLFYPFLCMAAQKDFQVEHLRIYGIIWLAGSVFAFLHLPIDIIFPVKVSAVINIGILSVVGIGLVLLITITDHLEKIIENVVGFISKMYEFGAVVFIVLFLVSFGISMLVKGRRRYV